MSGLIPIIVDSREQAPYEFDPIRFQVVRRALPAGDYSLVGAEERVAVERKSLADFVSTVIRSRERFHAELRKLKQYEFACVVVEATLRDVLEHRYPGSAHPNSIFGSAVSITAMGVPVFFCSDRQTARLFVESILQRLSQR